MAQKKDRAVWPKGSWTRLCFSFLPASSLSGHLAGLGGDHLQLLPLPLLPKMLQLLPPPSLLKEATPPFSAAQQREKNMQERC